MLEELTQSYSHSTPKILKVNSLIPMSQQEKLRKIKRLADLTVGKEVAIATEFNKVDTRIDGVDQKIQEIKTQIPDVQKALDRVEALVDGEKGEDGERGEKGDKGDAGKDGRDGKDGTNGKDGKDGVNGKDGKDGLNGVDGKDGADGFVDLTTIAYLEEKMDSIVEKVEDQLKNVPTKSQLPHAVGIVVREVQAGTGVTVDNSNPLKPIITATGGADWTYYATTWTTEPTFVEAITGGDVYSYTLDGTTRYRFVPTTYDATEDAFYTIFSTPTLSGLIIARG